MKRYECLACGALIKPWNKVRQYKIYVCPKCGLGMTDNPSVQKGDYHRDSVYQKESSQFKNIFQRRVNLIDSLNIKPGQALEIGSSTGLLLSLLKDKGWEVTGVEISPEAAEYAEQRGVKTIQTPVEKLDFPKNSFDLIILNHTLEHLQNPKEAIQNLSALLKMDGILFIDVPNFGGLSAKVYKTSWFALLPEEHLWHFTPPALSNILNSAGCRVIHQESVSGIFDYGNPLSEIFQSLAGRKKRFFPNLFTLIPNFVVTKLNQGATITVVARKVKQ